jgi:hypothetical protein
MTHLQLHKTPNLVSSEPGAAQLFSIEYGITSILRKWRSTRKHWYPKEKTTYDAYSFIGCCIDAKQQLSPDQARIFRRRIISEILPNGRLCNLDHEFRTAQSLSKNGWDIIQFGFCGEPGPDFVAKRNGVEIELESKCISPDIGLGVSYEFAARLMARLSRKIAGCYSGSFTKLYIELPGDVQRAGGLDGVTSDVLKSYANLESINQAIYWYKSRQARSMNFLLNIQIMVLANG